MSNCVTQSSQIVLSVMMCIWGARGASLGFFLVHNIVTNVCVNALNGPFARLVWYQYI